MLETEEYLFLADLVKADFTNCMIYGSDQLEFALLKDDRADFNFNFSNSLLRFQDTQGQYAYNPLYDFTDDTYYSGNILNVDPVFENTTMNNFNIERGSSGAEGIGLSGVPPNTDRNGTQRGTPPDEGAYEATVFPDPEP